MGITIKSKETSSKLTSYLAISTLQVELATFCVCSCKCNSSWVASYIHACINETPSIADLLDLILTLASVFPIIIAAKVRRD